VIASTVAVLVLLPLSAQAATSGAGFSDPAGDMAVPSLDLVSGRIQLDSAGRTRTLTMTATTRGELTGAPADYDLVTGTQVGATCYALATRVRWNGVSLAQAYQYASTFACTRQPTPMELATFAREVAQYAVGGDPVHATAGGRTVSATLPAPAWLRPGSLAGFAVLSHTPVLGFSSNVGFAEAANYDMAGLHRPWRVR
jgi:hypothetical protein